MSNLRVNKISNYTGDGPVIFSAGASVPNDKIINGTIIVNAGIVTSNSLIVDNLTLTGVMTATKYYGNGFQLTNLPGISKSFIIANSHFL